MVFRINSTFWVYLKPNLRNILFARLPRTKTREQCLKSVQIFEYQMMFVLVSLWLTLNRFHTLFLYSCCWFWTSSKLNGTKNFHKYERASLQSINRVTLEMKKKTRLKRRFALWNKMEMYTAFFVNPLSANPLKWSVTQIICRRFADELFECVWPFCGIDAYRVKQWISSRLKIILQ